MQGQRRLRRIFMFDGIFPRKRLKGKKTALLTFDAVRTTLELAHESADVFPPLKSALGAVVAVCNLADRVAAFDTDSETLAWRCIAMLDTIYTSIEGTSPDALPPDMLHNIVQFEQLLTEIQNTMEKCLQKCRLRRVLHLRRHESQLAKFTSKLDSAAEVFAIGAMTGQSVALANQTVALAHIEEEVKKISVVSSALEKSNIQLHDQVRSLQLTVVFLD
ncbi:hypothetical protein FB451DRAFT_1285739 [Mycena latifolia]|nr:hypothetical protein FB451DRAFT_1285739 [Mycena latifolia]